jgi:hypothetical protein
MLAKMTSKNQLTLPRSVTDEIGATEYFDVEVRDGQIVLTPVRMQRGDAVRAKLAALGLTAADVSDAVAWARQPASPVTMVQEPQPEYVLKPARTTAKAAPAKNKAAKA